MIEMNIEPSAILSVFLYFDYFRHPLTSDEVLKYCEKKTTKSDLEEVLQDLLTTGALVKKEAYYALATSEAILYERKKYEPLNEHLMKRAKWISWMLRLIPYVYGIGISGSLSKQGARDGSDIDFFILTKKGRLWFVKAAAILLKKVLFANSHKYLCVNYLLDEESLAISKHNRYQAIEVISLIPLYGKSVFQRFYEENDWVLDVFPNNNYRHQLENVSNRKWWPQRFFEFFFGGRRGDTIEQKAFIEFRKHGLKRKSEKNLAHSRFEYENGSSAYFPKDFEQEVLRNYQARKTTLAKI